MKQMADVKEYLGEKGEDLSVFLVSVDPDRDVRKPKSLFREF